MRAPGVAMSSPAGFPPAAELAALLDVHFDDPALLEQALVHRSWAFENGGARTNERLEFLGDAVLALVVTDEIYSAHPDEQEGRLAKVRSAAVKTGSLAGIARQLGLGRFVRLGRGEAGSGGADKDSILADTLEAVIGATYLDGGFATAYDLVQRLFSTRLAELARRDAALDYKTALQELSAARFDMLPRYEVADSGPDHEKTFEATVLVDGDVVGRGSGRSKKQAEQTAAREAYRSLVERVDTDGRDRVG
ncbi:ribonuclease III [Egicoccus halophilus]|uniref:Ribonuclease 3 n=1 Tax=Egicoccus halophilus TaxID=1670830 RepID=A0A8J3ADX7_9ACTN|nr:ribonuclease III [Egicoccus halophilus]GGI06456.1 ribonuclease 3 [Egicoccus halophilus]